MNSNQSKFDESKTSEISDILPSFTSYSSRLDHCYDKYESIYKHNRDLTRESKKVICTLHRLPGCPPAEQESCLVECAAQLTSLRDGIIGTTVSMLYGEPPYLYGPAHAGGIEEYVEALLFFSFLKGNIILSYGQVCCFLDSKAELLSFFESSDATLVEHQETTGALRGDVKVEGDVSETPHNPVLKCYFC
ncbi:Translin family [Trinorchestia longiramus]|nr:Translin family [Trinorchestia longiramus]